MPLCSTCPSIPLACPTPLLLSLVLPFHHPNNWQERPHESNFIDGDHVWPWLKALLLHPGQNTFISLLPIWREPDGLISQLLHRMFLGLHCYTLSSKTGCLADINNKMTQSTDWLVIVLSLELQFKLRQERIWCYTELIQNQTPNITICPQWHITLSNSSQWLAEMIQVLLHHIETVLKQLRVGYQYYLVSSF